MKILFLGNAQIIHTRRWVQYFANAGHEVHLISLTSSFVSMDNVHYHEVKKTPLRILNIVSLVRKVKKIIKSIKPEVLHVHYAGMYGLVGSLSGFHPFVLTAWGSDILIAGQSGLTSTLVKFVLNKADLITCDADHMVDVMLKLGVEHSKIKFINFGVDTNKFYPKKQNDSLKYKLGIDNSPVIISLRMLEPLYDIGTLIKAVPSVLEKIPSITILIAGTGPQEEELKKMATSLVVMESVKFLGFISNDELPQYLNIANVYVSTSTSDAGIACSTAEAMSCGLPVITTDFGANGDWIVDGKGGFVVPIKNPKMLAEKIIYLINNPEKSKRFGQMNQSIIKVRNDYHIEMKKMEDWYFKVK